MFEGLTKNWGKKNKKKQNYFPECQWQGTRGRGSSPSAGDKALGEEVAFPECWDLALGEEGFQFFLNGSV
jgi:hypothetical protein